MGIANGKDYLKRLDNAPREVWIEGERVEGPISEHRAFKNIARSLAHLYDMQHDPELQDTLTYVDNETGERYGRSFMIPKTQEELVKRREMFTAWAEFSGGMMGRSPDYLNASLAAMAAASDYFRQAGDQFGDNVENYYRYVRDHDLALTHTLINPQVNRSKSASEQKDQTIVARIMEERDDGMIIRGARMLATLGPLADEIMVFPSTYLKRGKEDEPYAFAFALPLATEGLRLICRETFDYGRSPLDHPLGAQFDEMDCMVVFDDVFVPWERVFLLRDFDLCNGVYSNTTATVHMSHQVIAKNEVKGKFLAGLACKMVDLIGVDQFQHVQTKIAKILWYSEAMHAFLRASEADAELNQWGMMTPDFGPLDVARNVSPRIYPDLAENIKKLGASGLMAIPTWDDISGPIEADIKKYYQARNADADERIRVFRLAWDTVLSAFGSRQTLYEHFFFGDPVRMSMTYYSNYDKQPLMDRIDAFLDRAMDRAGEGK